jgi:putative salt-induced outer membrane protein YdiY
LVKWWEACILPPFLGPHIGEWELLTMPQHAQWWGLALVLWSAVAAAQQAAMVPTAPEFPGVQLPADGAAMFPLPPTVPVPPAVDTQAPPPIPIPSAVPPQTPLTEPVVAAPAEVKPPPKVWEGSLELGLNGAEGNSQTFNLRGGGKLKRKTEANVFTNELDYRKDSADSVDTANKAFLESRWEHLFGQSPWTWFAHLTFDYDEFQAWDTRLAGDTGFGYRLLKSDVTQLTARLGGGASREFGGTDEETKPEGVFGLEFEQKLNSRHKITASAEYRPDVSDFADYRLVSKAGWEILLDEALHLSMKLGVADRYDSSPEGRKPNDLDYSLVLLMSF